MVEEIEKLKLSSGGHTTAQREQESSGSTTFVNEKNEGATPFEKDHHLARKGSLSLTSNVIITIFGLVSLVAVKRNMGYEAVGMLAFSLSFCQMFVIVGNMGFSQAHLKRVGEGLDPGMCNGTFLTMKFLLTLVMGGCIMGWYLVQKYLFHYEFGSEELETVLLIVVGQYMLLNMCLAFKTVFTARLEIARSNIPHAVGRFLVMLGKVGIAFTIGSVVYLAWAELAGIVAMLLAYLVLFRGQPLKRTNREYIRKYTSFAFPMIFIGFVGSLAYNVDKVMLQYLVDSTEVGIYTIAQRTVVALLVISTTISTILLVVFAELYQKKRLKDIQQISTRAEKYISTPLLPVIVFLLVVTRPALELVFGEGAGASAPILQLMLVTLYLEATMSPYNIQIVATGYLRIAMAIAFLALGLNIVLDLLLIPGELGGASLPDMGAKGAAYATLITLAARAIFVRFFAFRITRTKPNARLLIHLFSAGVAGLLAHLLRQTISFHWTQLLIYAPLVLGLYLLVMRLLGEFTRSDLDFYLDALHPGKMKAYIL